MENKQEMVNINANLVDEPTFSSFEKDGETITVVYLVDKILVEENKQLTIVFYNDEKLKIMEEILKKATPTKIVHSGKIIHLPFSDKSLNKEVAVNG